MKKLLTSFVLLALLFVSVSPAAFAADADPSSIELAGSPKSGSATNFHVDMPSAIDGTCYFLTLIPNHSGFSMSAANAGLTCDGAYVNVDFLDPSRVTGLSTALTYFTTKDASQDSALSSATSSIAAMLAQISTMLTAQTDWTEASTTKPAYIKNKPTIGVSYEGTTQRTGSFPIFKSGTIASGAVALNLTADGTAGGASLCPNGVIQDSVNVLFNDNTSSFQQSWAFSNSNKTLTITANKFTTANILSGILGQSAANGSVVKVSVWCY